MDYRAVVTVVMTEHLTDERPGSPRHGIFQMRMDGSPAPFFSHFSTICVPLPPFPPLPARLPDDEDDDEPPTISESPQEFLYRLQRAEKSNKAGGNDAVPPAVAGPMNGNGRGRKVSTFGGGAKKLQKKEGGTVFVCTSCGSEHHQWRGRCGTCKEWNTIEERRAPAAGGSKGRATGFGSLGRGEPAASAAWRKSGGSWLDGLGDYDGGGYGNGGPVSMTDVCRDLLRDDAGGDAGGASSLTWQARERRTTVPDDPELNAVLGGGLMPGSISLVGGDPGACVRSCCSAPRASPVS